MTTLFGAKSFSGNPASIATARKFAVDLVMPLHPELCDAVGLMVSELATNAVLHGHTDYVVDVESLATSVRVEVSDVGPGLPVRREAPPTATRGRGLSIVEGFADSWGVVLGKPDLGKSVWFELLVQTAEPTVGRS